MGDTIAERLARLDCCAISDALDQLDLPPSVTGLRSLAAHRRISGQVITVTLAAGKPPADAPARHLCTSAIDRAAEGQVIVVEQRTGIECAGWGGILSNAARLRGISGVIVEGLARDVDEADEIGFTIFARGATARTARGRIHEAGTGAPIPGRRRGRSHRRLGGGRCQRHPPSWRPTRSRAVLAAAERIAAREAEMTKDRPGRPTGLESHGRNLRTAAGDK